MPCWRVFERPLRFIEDIENTVARRAAGLSPTWPPCFSQLLGKFGPKVMQSQVTRSGQVTQLQNDFPIAPRLQCFRESYETFGIGEGHQCLQNLYLGFFHIGDLMSGHFCDLPIISQCNGQKISSVIFTLAQAYLSGIISCRTVVDNSSKNLHFLSLERSFEVTRGHQPSLANKFWSRVRDVGLVSVSLSRPGESTDM